MGRLKSLFLMAAAVLSLGVATAAGMDKGAVTNAENGKNYAQLFDYKTDSVHVTEFYDASAKVASDQGKSGLLFSSVKSGADAKNTTFSYKGTLSGAFDMDFRVYSEKTYVEMDESKNFTHTLMAWGGPNLGQTLNEYVEDSFNPYLDAKEIGIKFSSSTNPDAWFVLYIRGGNPDGRADLATARVWTSADKGNYFSGDTSESAWPYALCGYGLRPADGESYGVWPLFPAVYSGYGMSPAYNCYAWAAQYTPMTTSFSNMAVAGSEESAQVKFDPETMTVSVWNNLFKKYLPVRHLDNFNGFNEEGWKSFFGTLNKEDFQNGYDVSISFTDMTENTTTAGILTGSQFGVNNETYQYATFDTAYDRYANMVIYSINGMNLTESNSKTTPIVQSDLRETCTSAEVDLTPTVSDVNLGNIAYTGEVTWRFGEESGEVVASEGKYLFKPTKEGQYLISYGSQSGENYNSTPAFAKILTVGGHNFGEWVSEVPARVGFDGVKGHKVCSLCSLNYDANGALIDDLTIEALHGIQYTSLSLKGDIGLNFYVYLGNADSASAMIGFGENSVSAAGVYDETSKCFKFSYGVAPKNYKEKVTISVSDTDITGEYSVEQYLNAVGESDDAYNVVAALKKYCENARIYFAEEAAIKTDALEADLSKYAYSVSGTEENVELMGASLILESEISVNVYFKATNIGNIVCKVNQQEVEPILVNEANSLYVIKIDNIAASDIDEMYIISIGGINISYGVLSYVRAVANQTENVALDNLVKALYELSVQAEGFFK